jgi:ribonuclease HI
LEYRGVDLQSGEEIFHQQFEIWTNNIGEFLAIVHGLAYCRDASLTRPNGKAVHRPNTIYSDSKTAISRTKQGKCKSKFRTLQPERTVRNAVERAEKRLKKNWIPSTLLKRNTDERGEIPADFGRK